MRKNLHFAFLLILALLVNLPVYTQYYHEQNIQDEGDLIWSDEFEGTGAPDESKWERQEYNRRNNDNGPDGWWSKEDSYLDGSGNLVIRVRKIEDKNNDGDSCDFSVGALRSKGKFEQLYGIFEIRCQLPTQPGWWVAFWMMQGNVSSVGNGGVDGMEVDIMEGFGWTNKINQAFHWDGYGDEHKSLGNAEYPAGIREGFHTYTLEWRPEIYIFYIDGEETWRSVGGGVCEHPGYVKVTGEISTEEWAINEYWSNHPSNASYPDSFLVDYVRVYDIGAIDPPASAGSVSALNQFKIQPNPVEDNVKITWDAFSAVNSAEISVLNSTGKILKSFSNVMEDTTLPVNELSAGLYFLSLKQGDAIDYLKFVKK